MIEYKLISDYGLIGNTRTVALVGLDGSIDWCCFPYLDQPSVFGCLLDDQRGGRFRIGVPDVWGEQQYIADTNVLCTKFKKNGGTVIVTDFMPLETEFSKGHFSTRDQIYRLIECEGEEMEVEAEWSPRFNYGLNKAVIRKNEDIWTASDSENFLFLAGLEGLDIEEETFGPSVKGRFKIRPGEKKKIVTGWNIHDIKQDFERSDQALVKTIDLWRKWVHSDGAVHCHEWAGDWLSMLIRSELTIKLLDFCDTGAIVAAPTTSLPEEIGGVRNWDYRYSWIRDTSLSVQALVSMGHEAEAVEFLQWIENVAAAEFKKTGTLQIMYGINGQTELTEQTLPHLEGYRKSKPVNIGNGAAKQFQLETYGELINTAHELVRRGYNLQPQVSNFLQMVADYVSETWQQPDHGIWEIRKSPAHFTYSKVMAWHALDTACMLFKNAVPEKALHWKETAGKIAEAVLERGFSRKLNSFIQSFDGEDLDASNLRIPLLEFLPMDDYRVQGTIDCALHELTDNGLVKRYINDDGLPGSEGAFGLCSFWLVDALALSQRVEEAKEIFSKVIARANHLGLFPEQFDCSNGEFLGNFPQGLTHIGAINSALYIAYAEGKPVPHPLPIGTREHREHMGRQ